LNIQERLAQATKLNEVTGCLEWAKSVDSFGYGVISVNGRQEKAHRVAYRLAFGEIPKELCVLHTCDNPKCLNHSHLFLGFRADNNADRKAKGRNADLRGGRQGSSALNVLQVRVIKKLCDLSSMSQRAIGDIFGVADTTISAIKTKKSWGHIK